MSPSPSPGSPPHLERRVAPCQQRWIVPIPGTARLHRMQENARAANVELTREDLREIEDAGP
jgi:diketogulonate reductase-like aldo/keto reductase